MFVSQTPLSLPTKFAAIGHSVLRHDDWPGWAQQSDRSQDHEGASGLPLWL